MTTPTASIRSPTPRNSHNHNHTFANLGRCSQCPDLAAAMMTTRGRRMWIWVVVIGCVFACYQNIIFQSVTVLPALKQTVEVSYATALITAMVGTATETMDSEDYDDMDENVIVNATAPKQMNDSRAAATEIVSLEATQRSISQRRPRVVLLADIWAKETWNALILHGELVVAEPKTSLTASRDVDGSQVGTDRLILSRYGTIQVSTQEEQARHRDYERDWFQKCTDKDDNDDNKRNDHRGGSNRQIRPTCNTFHELDVANGDDKNNTGDNAMNLLRPPILTDHIELLSMGGSWRSVWKMVSLTSNATITTTTTTSTTGTQSPTDLVLKILQLNREFDDESYNMHEMDAKVMDHLSSSPHIVISYGFCGQSVMTECATSSGRTLIKDPKLPWVERLRIARDLARGLAELHAFMPLRRDFDKSMALPAHDNGTRRLLRPTKLVFAHHDINPSNTIAVDQRIVWNDFNLGILGRHYSNDLELEGSKMTVNNNRTTQTCPVPIRYNGALWRSPEELQNQTGFLDDSNDNPHAMQAADVYSLGNLLFQVLTKHQPWSHLEDEEDETKLDNTNADTKQESLAKIARAKLDGKLPFVPDYYLEKKVAQILWNVTQACYHRDPADRVSAWDVADILGRVYEQQAHVEGRKKHFWKKTIETTNLTNT